MLLKLPVSPSTVNNVATYSIKAMLAWKSITNISPIEIKHSTVIELKASINAHLRVQKWSYTAVL